MFVNPMRIDINFRRILFVTALTLLAIGATSQLGHCQGAYNIDRDAKLFTAQGQTYTIINRIGALNLTFEYIVSGSPASLTMTINGCMRGGTCDNLDTYSTVANSNRKITGLYDSYTVTVTTLSGGSSPTVQMNTFFTANSSPASAQGTLAAQVQGSGAAGSANVGNPVLVGGKDGSGNTQTLGVGSGTNSVGTIFAAGSTDGIANGNHGQVGSVAGGGFILDSSPYLFNGSTWDRAFYCPNTSTFSVASTTTQIVPLSGTTKIRICSFSLNPSTVTAGSVDIVYGTGASCGTGTTTLTGAYTLPASAVVSITPGMAPTGALITPASQAVCVRTVTSTVAGFMTWEQH